MNFGGQAGNAFVHVTLQPLVSIDCSRIIWQVSAESVWNELCTLQYMCMWKFLKVVWFGLVAIFLCWLEINAIFLFCFLASCLSQSMKTKITKCSSWFLLHFSPFLYKIRTKSRTLVHLLHRLLQFYTIPCLLHRSTLKLGFDDACTLMK